MRGIMFLTYILLFSGCTNKPVNGYVTSQDPIRLECIDGNIWAVNNSGKVDLEQECDE